MADLIATGTIIAHRYEILERISEGGMATVFRGRRLPDGQTIALKVLRDQFATDLEFVERFQREAKAVSELTHPHMVRVYDSGNDGAVHYIAMEYVEGQNLKELLRVRGRFEPEEAVSIVAQVCEVLEFAHSHGLVHRDIKPQNILLTRDGQVKVTDFGIARAASAATITQAGTMLGTVQYLAPEQARGAIVGRAADIYAMGVVLYELVTGVLPFGGDSPVAIAIKHIHQTPPRPRAIVPMLPARLEAIILRAMAKSPYDRYCSAGDLRSDLLGETDLWQTAPAAVPHDEAPTVILRPDTSGRPALPRLVQEQLVSPSVVAGVLLVIFVGVLFGGWRAFGRYLSVPEVTVPTIVGKSLTDAERVAGPLRLSLQASEVFSGTVPAGTIVSQDQAPGRLVKVGRVIGVEVSIGPEVVIVPDVQHRSLIEAQLMIDQARLRLGELREAYEDTLQSGFILKQDPQPGAKVPRDRTVNLVVSKGPQRIEMPQLVGRSLQDVRKILQDLGVTVQEVRTRVMADQASGIVLEQTPAAGTRIRAQDPVVVTVSVKPGDESKPPSTPVVTAVPAAPKASAHTQVTRVRLVVPEGDREQLVKIVVVDEQGPHTVYEKMHAPGTHVDQVIRSQGYTIIQVFVQNRLIQEIRP